MRVEIFMRVFARSFPPLPSFYFSSGFFFFVVEPSLSLSLFRLLSPLSRVVRAINFS